ncbi:MAG TPA: glycosyltransferase family 2 protein, partial [Euzebya sp.]|nr:glycosyltransferase family 2 protein [Euzebya sp.]
MSSPPVLSVCIPTYNRPDMLERALRSVTDGPRPPAGEVEIVVSDNSTDERSRHLSTSLLGGWDGPTQYVLNRPGVGAEPNFNRCLELATGTWVLILHDDDYLLRGVEPLLKAIRTASDGVRVQLFGVQVVDQHERVIKRQTFRAESRLTP